MDNLNNRYRPERQVAFGEIRINSSRLVGVLIAAALLQCCIHVLADDFGEPSLGHPVAPVSFSSVDPSVGCADFPLEEEIGTCDVICPGWYASGEVLAWQMRQQGLDYAISADGNALELGGTVENVAFSRDAGYRLGLGYVTRTGWDLGFRFTDFETNQTASATAPPNGTLWATRSHPARSEQAETAMAYAAMDYQTFDFEVGRWFEVNRFAAIRIIGGLRWLNADQQLTIQYDDQDFTDSVVYDQKTDRAFGIRVGAEGHWNLRDGWSLFARGTGSIAYTESDCRMLETDEAGDKLIVDISDRFSGSLTNLEAAVGLSWRPGNWDIRSGYEMTNWSNLRNRTTFDGTHEGSSSSVPLDLLLEGLFFGVAYSH